MKTNPNEPVNPSIAERYTSKNGSIKPTLISSYGGLTKREHMAIEFTKAICANPHSYDMMNEQQIVIFGISLADKLIQKLNEEKS